MMKYFARRGILVRPWLSLVTEIIALVMVSTAVVVMAVLMVMARCELRAMLAAAGEKHRKEKRENNTRHSCFEACCGPCFDQGGGPNLLF